MGTTLVSTRSDEDEQRLSRDDQCEHHVHGTMHHRGCHRRPRVLLPSLIRRYIQHLRGLHLTPPVRRYDDRQRHHCVRHAQNLGPQCKEGDRASVPLPVRPPHHRAPAPTGVGLPNTIQHVNLLCSFGLAAAYGYLLMGDKRKISTGFKVQDSLKRTQQKNDELESQHQSLVKQVEEQDSRIKQLMQQLAEAKRKVSSK